MRRLAVIITGCVALSACVSPRVTFAPRSWTERLPELQHASRWQLEGRAAAAVGTQGWQASLDWRERGDDTEVRLAGPLGVGATALKKTPAGLSLNGAPPNPAVFAALTERLGFDLPLAQLRFWLLGVPDPAAPFDLTRNSQDRLLELQQSGWTIDYDRYLPVDGDLLPTRVVLTREGVRVRIVVDHWEAPK